MPDNPTRLTYVSVMLNMITGGRAYRGSEESPAGFLTLTTTGRRSGKVRRVHLIYIRDGAAYVVTASNGGGPRNPGWFYNLSANPEVTIDAHGRHMRARAEVADPQKRAELWARLVAIAPMYAGYEKHTQREIPMVLVTPTDEPSPSA